MYDFLDDWFRTDECHDCGFINAFGKLGSESPRVAETARAQKQALQAYVAALARETGALAEVGPQLALLAEGAQTTAAIDGTPDAAAHARSAARLLISATLGQQA